MNSIWGKRKFVFIIRDEYYSLSQSMSLSLLSYLSCLGTNAMTSDPTQNHDRSTPTACVFSQGVPRFYDLSTPSFAQGSSRIATYPPMLSGQSAAKTFREYQQFFSVIKLFFIDI